MRLGFTSEPEGLPFAVFGNFVSERKCLPQAGFICLVLIVEASASLGQLILKTRLLLHTPSACVPDLELQLQVVAATVLENGNVFWGRLFYPFSQPQSLWLGAVVFMDSLREARQRRKARRAVLPRKTSSCVGFHASLFETKFCYWRKFEKYWSGMLTSSLGVRGTSVLKSVPFRYPEKWELRLTTSRFCAAWVVWATKWNDAFTDVTPHLGRS